MTVEGTAFLVGRGRRKGQRLLLVPEFVAPGDDATELVRVVSGPVGQDGPGVRSVTLRAGTAGVVFQRYRLSAADVDGTPDAHLDQAYRPLTLTYGFICLDQQIDEVDEDDLTTARDAALDTFRRFYRTERERRNFPVEISRPFLVKSRVRPVPQSVTGRPPVPANAEPMKTAPVGPPHRNGRYLRPIVVARNALLGLAALAIAGGAVLLVSQGGRDRVIVPTVLGMNGADATRRLREAGLDPTPTVATSPIACAGGTVVRQSPGGGSTVGRNSSVRIITCPAPVPAAVAVHIDSGVLDGTALSRGVPVVAADPGQVGFTPLDGPASFQVDGNGYVWLLDQVNQRLLRWQRGSPIPMAVALGTSDVTDFAVAPDGSVYYTTAQGGLWHTGTRLGAAIPVPAAVTGALRFGPDGTLYVVTGTPGRWVPVVDGRGSPLTPAAQLGGTVPYPPLPDRSELTVPVVSRRQIDVTLADAGGNRIRAWSLTSDLDLDATRLFTGVVRGAPVLAVTVLAPARGFGRSKEPAGSRVVLVALTPTGGQVLLVLPAPGAGPSGTGVLFGPDGTCYQLVDDPRTGATVWAYPT